MDERPDDELLIAAGEGDREAFGQFVARHQRAVVGYVQRYLGRVDYATAEDLAQDVFVAAWQAASRYRPQAKALAWLYRMATNACLNHQRQARLRRVVSLSDDTSFEPAGSAGEQPERRAVARDQLVQVNRALARLAPNQRAALLLRHDRELSYVEIGSALQMSVSAVESVLAVRELLTPAQRQEFVQRVLRPVFRMGPPGRRGGGGPEGRNHEGRHGGPPEPGPGPDPGEH